jgi:hypothetical protein
MSAQTSDRISSMAARHRTMTVLRLRALVSDDQSAETLAAEIRSMAASLARQDETKGLRKLWKKVTGK